ncbi:hypothetical protein CC1G_08062 [Coprinopsis cinerea okayama7|uniref:F-box domain-containing protein n=1 Tax=Coprinopsis cinerea (strain Okayama-7 / 130 / ATCC MYA-4618 / FGSC 9003) TaxID=240176 RepID=A8NVL2_COPC7|nr:hypothetical protein CC1G_08062 [Coprinopsis cinerea okayama7\|eukprot:XP_001836677.2 hypothetical protein CC1G_08062 [Coprinopsis cinerea okayama7\
MAPSPPSTLLSYFKDSTVRVSQESNPYQNPILAPYYASTSNHLSPDLLPQYNTHLSKMEAMTLQAREDVARLEIELNEARQRLRHTIDEYVSCRSLAAPIRRLPTELLSSIFVGVVQRPKPFSSEDVRRLTVLRLVCKKWQEVVDTTHALWSGLTFDVYVTRPQEIRHYLEQWFARAGTHPLHLSLDLAPVRGEGDLHLRGFFYQPGYRWTSLSFLGAPSRWIRCLFQTLHGKEYSQLTQTEGFECSWKNLEELEVNYNWDNHASPFLSTPIFPLSRRSPNLKRLTFTRATQPFFSHNTLRYLYLRDFRGSQRALVKALSVLPSLEEFELFASLFKAEDPWDAVDEENMSKVNVSTFHLSGTSRPLEVFEGRFRFPKLQMVRFTGVRPAEWSDGKLAGFFNRSGQELEEISFIQSAFPSVYIAETLSALRSKVKRILVKDFEFIAQLAPWPTSKLHGLEVLVAETPPSEELLRSMIEVFGRRKEAIERGEIIGRGVVRLYVQKGWPSYMITHRDYMQKMEEVGVQMVLTPYE